MHIALSGGNTPQLWFARLAGEYSRDINWPRLHFYWVDERYVPHDAPESNYGVARKILFDKVPVPAGNLHPVPVSGNIENDVKAYEEEIAGHVPYAGALPVFDLLLLGMGTDGHTASIFPGQLDLFDPQAAPVVVSVHPQTKQQRVTLTGPVINHAKKIYLMVTGENKARLLKDIFENESIKDNYPVSHVRIPDVEWLIDQPAAKLLLQK